MEIILNYLQRYKDGFITKEDMENKILEMKVNNEITSMEYYYFKEQLNKIGEI